MSKTRNNASLFDDDFEVTYEEDVPFTYNFETKPVNKVSSDQTVVIPSPSRKSKAARVPVNNKLPKDNYKETYEEDYEDEPYEDDYFDSNDFSDDEEYDDDEYDDYDRSPYGRRKSAPKSRRRSASPRRSRLFGSAKKTAKYGTKAIYHVARKVVRIVSLLITAGTLGMLAYNFWRGAAPYGDPETILTDKNYALLSYAAVAALFLLFELIAFFWSMTRMRIREGRKVYKEDTGRGLFSFIFIYVASYVSFLLCSFLPDTLGSYAVLNGIKGALDVFGSLHNVLFGLCAAGVISCLVRRHML